MSIKTLEIQEIVESILYKLIVESPPQIKGQLKRDVGSCCLGDVCQVFVNKGLLEETSSIFERGIGFTAPERNIGWQFLELPIYVQKTLGVTCDIDIFNSKSISVTSLAKLNDDSVKKPILGLLFLHQINLKFVPEKFYNLKQIVTETINLYTLKDALVHLELVVYQAKRILNGEPD